MKHAVRYDWTRIVWPSGKTLYVVKLPRVTLNVWRMGIGLWRWVHVTPPIDDMNPIARMGTAPTMLDAKIAAELAIGEQPQTDFGWNEGTDGRHEEAADIPF